MAITILCPSYIVGANRGLSVVEEVVLVSDDDRVIGRMEKAMAHREGKLHRAISVCLFDSTGRWLLQRRSLMKYHSPGKWSNACCGHPRWNEAPATAASRRLFEELGVTCPLSFCTAFVYRADVGGGMVEHEFDHLFTGIFEGPIIPNPDEVCEVSWWQRSSIEDSLTREPQLFTPWFPLIFERINGTTG
jgi:isopentenyl-diphosphate delta-isomerase